MEFRLEQRFAAAPATVEAAVLDPRFVARLGELPRLGHPTLLAEEHEGTVVRREVRYAFVGELSAAVTAVVDPEKLTWVDVGVHDLAAHRSRHHIVPDHYGSRLSCAYETMLTPSGEGTARVTAGELRVHVPLVGGRVERAIVSGLVEHAAREEAALADWLARPQEQG
jgi:hypothetical protein